MNDTNNSNESTYKINLVDGLDLTGTSKSINDNTPNKKSFKFVDSFDSGFQVNNQNESNYNSTNIFFKPNNSVGNNSNAFMNKMSDDFAVNITNSTYEKNNAGNTNEKNSNDNFAVSITADSSYGKNNIESLDERENNDGFVIPITTDYNNRGDNSDEFAIPILEIEEDNNNDIELLELNEESNSNTNQVVVPSFDFSNNSHSATDNTDVSNDSSYKEEVELEDSNSLEDELINDSNVNSQIDNFLDANSQENKSRMDSLLRGEASSKVELERKTIRQNNFLFGVLVSNAVVFVIILLIAIFGSGNIFSLKGRNAYYQDKTYENLDIYQTAVVTDNVYKNVKIDGLEDAKQLIIKDSNNQKNKCTNIEVKEIETRMEKEFGIVAVNLCELNVSLAKEIEKVFKTVFNEFPDVKKYITNLTLINDDKGYIANFVSARLFAKSNTWNTYPNVYKMTINLNSEYFLDLDRFTSDVETNTSWGYFPKNTTKSSLVAHEIGHYLSFLAQLNNSDQIDSMVLLTKRNYKTYKKIIDVSNDGSFSYKIINEAFENYNKANSNVYSDIDEFRGTISEYALATDAYGQPIYDETIAEAFHDYYNNKNKAKKTSLEIVKVLKKYLNN